MTTPGCTTANRFSQSIVDDLVHLREVEDEAAVDGVGSAREAGAGAASDDGDAQLRAHRDSVLDLGFRARSQADGSTADGRPLGFVVREAREHVLVDDEPVAWNPASEGLEEYVQAEALVRLDVHCAIVNAQRSGRLHAERLKQPADSLLDLVADGAHGLEVLAGGVGELPVLVTLAGKSGHASPQPIVTTTSAACTISSVQGLGNSWAMSMPTSAIARTADGLISFPGLGTAGPRDGVVAGEVVEPTEGHLRAAGVVDAEEEHRGDAVGGLAFDLRQGLEALAGESLRDQGQERHDTRIGRELVVAGGEEQLDRLGAEDAFELVRRLAAAERRATC